MSVYLTKKQKIYAVEGEKGDNKETGKHSFKITCQEEKINCISWVTFSEELPLGQAFVGTLSKVKCTLDH